MPNPLTAKQRSVLLYVIKHTREHGYPPTLHEIGDEMGYNSHNAASQHLRLIAKKGYISLADGKKSRGIKVLRRIRESA